MIVPELVTGSTTPIAFLDPARIVIFLLGYGLPVLLIRELAIRHKVGLRGLILFGVAYGMLNEGLLAKTLVSHGTLPVEQYSHYGFYFGLAIPWLACICFWHAMASVVFPIYITHYLYREDRARPWLEGKVTIALAIVDVALCSFAFLRFPVPNSPGEPTQLAILLVLVLGFLGLGLWQKGRILTEEDGQSRAPVVLGFSILVPFILLSVLAASHFAPALYFAAFGAVIYGYYRIMRRPGYLTLPGFLWFGFGWYLQNAVLSSLIRMSNPIVGATTAVLDAFVLVFVWRAIYLTHQSQMMASKNRYFPTNDAR